MGFQSDLSCDRLRQLSCDLVLIILSARNLEIFYKYKKDGGKLTFYSTIFSKAIFQMIANKQYRYRPAIVQVCEVRPLHKSSEAVIRRLPCKRLVIEITPFIPTCASRRSPYSHLKRRWRPSLRPSSRRRTQVRGTLNKLA